MCNVLEDVDHLTESYIFCSYLSTIAAGTDGRNIAGLLSGIGNTGTIVVLLLSGLIVVLIYVSLVHW